MYATVTYQSMGHTVLIVEDQPTLARNMARFLTARGCVSELATTALDAARRLREVPVDLVMLDINLPDCNGLDFFRAIRPFYPRLRAIVMSGHVTEDDRTHARELGVEEILIKPFPLSALEELVSDDRRNVEPSI